MHDIEKFNQHVGDAYDDLTASQDSMQKELKTLKSQNTKLQSQVETLIHENTELRNECLDVQTRLMSNDLIFFGVEARHIDGSEREHYETTLR